MTQPYNPVYRIVLWSVIMGLLIFVVAACATSPVVPVPVSCVPDNLGAPFVYPATPAALKGSPDIYSTAKLLKADDFLKTKRLEAVEPVIDICRKAPRSLVPNAVAAKDPLLNPRGLTPEEAASTPSFWTKAKDWLH